MCRHATLRPPTNHKLLKQDRRGIFEKIADMLVLRRQHATPGNSQTCSVLTTASDATEIDKIVSVGMATLHRLFEIIVAS